MLPFGRLYQYKLYVSVIKWFMRENLFYRNISANKCRKNGRTGKSPTAIPTELMYLCTVPTTT